MWLFSAFVIFVVQVAGGMLEPVLNIVWEPMPRVNLVNRDRIHEESYQLQPIWGCYVHHMYIW